MSTTIFTRMSSLAAETGSVNLGQGFPDEDGPAEVLEAAATAMRAGHNQYAPLPGVPPLVEAIRAHQRRRYGLDPEAVQVTFGATEAIAAALLALCEPGDEVVALEPFYDSYAACTRLARAQIVPVTLAPPDFALEPDALRAAVTERTRLILLNSPHNPTGRVLTRPELEAVADICRERDLVAVTDEVYEHLVFDGEHVPLATLPGMAERTLTISSAGKTFSLTGWKVGWVTGPRELVEQVQRVKQYLSFAGGTPLQHAVAAALDAGDGWPAQLCSALRAKRDRLCDGLGAAGLTTYRPQGTYFALTDVRSVGCEDGIAFALDLPHRAGVVAIPAAVFYADEARGRSLVRFAFCKRDEVLDEAIARLTRL